MCQHVMCHPPKSTGDGGSEARRRRYVGDPRVGEPVMRLTWRRAWARDGAAPEASSKRRAPRRRRTMSR